MVVTCFPRTPFALSLSKGCTFSGLSLEGQSFDKLMTNGFGKRSHG